MGKTIKTFGQALMIIFLIIGVIVLMLLLSNPLFVSGGMAVGTFIGIAGVGIIIGLPLMAFGDLMMDVKDIKILLISYM